MAIEPRDLQYAGAEPGIPIPSLLSFYAGDETVTQMDFYVPSNITGTGDLIFNIRINGATQYAGGARPTIANGTRTVSLTGLSIALNDGDLVELDLDELPTVVPAIPWGWKVTTDDGVADTTDIAAEIAAAAAKATPVDADSFGIVDSEASSVLKELTWANLKATLKTYFDTQYPAETATTVGSLINAAGAATPNDGDFVATAESGGLLKKITWTNAKAFLKTYFDTVYQAVLVSGTNIKTINSASLLGSGDIAISGSVATDAIFDAKGDIAGGTGANTAARLPVGTDGQILAADSAETTGLKWISAPGGGDLIAANNLSDLDDAPTALTNLGLTAAAAEINILDGATLSTTELNYVDGVTSAIQTQLDGKQASDADLTAIAGLSPSNDDVLQRKAGAWANRTLAQLRADHADTPIGVACSDETTALTIGTAKATFRMPFAFTVTGVRASLTTAQTSGSIFTVDINEGGTSILSTKLTIDNGEKTSTTAATAAVVSDSALADDAEITIDIDQIGDGTAAGLKVWLIGYKS